MILSFAPDCVLLYSSYASIEHASEFVTEERLPDRATFKSAHELSGKQLGNKPGFEMSVFCRPVRSIEAVMGSESV